jgi:1-acyl-sn-glycerol-3-phosphate acyltransferase
MILFKYLEIVFQLLYAFFVVILQFPWITTEHKKKILSKWCGGMLDILGVKLEVVGRDIDYSGGVLFAANHISWLDILVIMAWHPMRFVAKKEVRGWPVFGWFAMQINTLFIDRQLKGDSKNVSKQMAQALKNGDHVCIFPEGTSTSGDSVLEFKPNLFQSAIDADVACQPISITYQNAHTGVLSHGPAFIGDMGLLISIQNTLKAAPLKVMVAITPTCKPAIERKALSDEAWDLIVQSRPIKT